MSRPRDDNAHQLVDADTAARIGADKPGQIRSRTVHDGRIVDLAIDTVRFPDGSQGELELIRHSGAAAILPLLDDGDDPRLVLLRQYRYAAGGDIYEVPAGRPEHGESWERCAHRELEEETGLTARNLQHLTTIYTTPGFTDERIHLFLATGIGEGTRDLDDDEFVHPVRMNLSTAVQHIRDGIIIDAKSIATILYVAAFR